MNETDMAITDVAISAPTPVVSVSPVVLSAPGRAVDLQMRVSAPVTGLELPIILLSHGHGHSNNLSSLNGYGPLANFWAAHGFVVIQPTCLTWAYLRTTLHPEDSSWPAARTALMESPNPLGRIESR